MIDYCEIPDDGEQWELFARDFLARLGFYVESPPDRGPDRGKDMLVSEQVRGKLHSYRFLWLVSCKHFAHSGKAVSENEHERNVLERVRGFHADGFIGFYSTVPSSGLNDRLRQLRDARDLKDYKFFDGRVIESYLVTGGFSDLMMRYLPESYKQCKPLQLVTPEYEALICDYCGKDLLLALFEKEYNANIVQAFRPIGNKTRVEEIYFACKGACDRALLERARARRLETAWLDVSDLVIPVEYLRKWFAFVNRIRDGTDVYSDAAFEKMKRALGVLAQRTLRFTTEEERERYKALLEMPLF